jgi:hypothetical protein
MCIWRELSARAPGRKCLRIPGRGKLKISVILVTVSSRVSLEWPNRVAASLPNYQIPIPGMKMIVCDLPSNARATDDIKIVVQTEIVTITIETPHQRRCSTCCSRRVLCLFEFDDPFHQMVQNKQTSRPGCFIDNYDSVRKQWNGSHGGSTQCQCQFLCPRFALEPGLADGRTWACCTIRMIGIRGHIHRSWSVC